MASSKRFLSDSWYRVASLRPKLRDHLTVSLHNYRAARWYVLSDPVQNKVHRLSPQAYAIVSCMDGLRSVDELWAETGAVFGDEAPTQGEVIELIGQLYRNDLLWSDIQPHLAEVFERQNHSLRSKILQWLMNPLALRLPLLDPHDFLTRTLPLVRPLIGVAGGVLWLAVVLPAVALTVLYWTELTENISDRMLSPDNLLLMLLIYPAIKMLHELGHGYANRAYGGDVHELGLMLLVLLPMPYVEVSSSSGLRDKWKRLTVRSAGILVELFIAALAIYVWHFVEPGLLRAISFNIFIAAGVSSLLFNANPLLRYDGYYILIDLIEIPNLANRGSQYFSYLFHRYAFGAQDLPVFNATFGEKVWFLLYTPLSFAYRLAITFGIALTLFGKYMVVGVALAIWGIVVGILVPTGRVVWALLASQRYASVRLRAVGLSLSALLVLALVGWLVPVPLHTTAEGVVWLPNEAIIRAAADGFVDQLLVPTGVAVTRGQVVIRTSDPEMATKQRVLRAHVAELQSKLDSVRFTDQVESELIQTELALARRELAAVDAKMTALSATADSDGDLVIATPDDLSGRFMHKGDILAFVLPFDGVRLVRVAVEQADIDLVRSHAKSVRVKLPDRPDQDFPVVAIREIPEARDRLPSAALGPNGGGSMLVDPRDKDGVVTLSRVFQLELELQTPIRGAGYGGLAYVRFEHQPEPAVWQAWRRARQLLLSRIQI